jgi:ribosomal protein S18 acetylase RimI-like enzyme
MIRQALASDIDSILEIEHKCFKHQWTMSKNVIKYNIKNIKVYLNNNNKVIGYIRTLTYKRLKQNVHKDTRYTYVYSIAILKEYRTKGILKELLDTISTTYTTLRVNVNNTRAINAYFKYNFKIYRYNSNNTYSMIRNNNHLRNDVLP